ncbi:hypothetical protein J2Z50_002157 [Ensifer mexicanus]|nr:hypothetical protein [Sinorhizobium mexicanum]
MNWIPILSPNMTAEAAIPNTGWRYRTLAAMGAGTSRSMLSHRNRPATVTIRPR